MQSDKTSKKTRKSANESSALSKSEPVETTSAKRHRKAATVAVPETASKQTISKPKAMAAAAAGGATVATAIDPVGLAIPEAGSATLEVSRERIQELAYQLWIADGKPHGNHHEHWVRAERELLLAR